MKHKLELPYHYGEIVSERLKTLELDKKYQGFTINEDLEIIKTECSIESNNSWNYHNNYDDSEGVLKVENTQKWWTLDEAEIKKIQEDNINKAVDSLEEEIGRLYFIRNKIYIHAK